MSPQKLLYVVNAGRLPYAAAFDLQREIVAARKSNTIPDVLLFCEHPHVITLGRNGDLKNLLATQNVLKQMNVEFRETDRGGDITYHGPGQIVGYPILDLTQHRRDVRWYVEQLEEVMIRTAADYGLAARRVLCQHGIWIDATPGSLGARGLPDAQEAGLLGGRSFSSDMKATSRNAAASRQGTASAVPLSQRFGASAPEGSRQPDPAEDAHQSQQTSAGGAAQLSPARKGWVSHEKTSSAAVGPDEGRVGATQACETNLSPASGDRNEEKLAALGVHLSRWVTSHGFAFNVSTDLRFFDLIIPCGIHDKRATSLERALGRTVPTEEACDHLTRQFAEIFACEIHRISLDELRCAITLQSANAHRL